MLRTYRYAFSTLGCPELTLDGVIDLAARHYVDAVELRTLENSLDLPALFAKQGLGSVWESARRHPSVQLLSLSTSFRLAGSTEADRAAFLDYVDWAEKLGVKWLRVFDGGHPGDPASVDEAIATLRWWKQLRAERYWRSDVMVETHDGLVAAPELLRVCHEVEGVHLLWDAHNTWRKTGENPVDLWARIAPHVVHLHVKDSVSQASEFLPYTYVLPGEGEFPMGPLVAALNRDHYAGAVSLEWERQWHPQLPPLEDALHAARQRRWW